MSTTVHHRGPSPEEEAHELHHLPVSRPIAAVLLVGFLLLVVVRPLLLLRSEEIQGIFATFFGRLAFLPQDTSSLREQNRKLRTTLDEFDDDLEKNARFSDRLQPIWQKVMARLGSGHETVHVGLGGWLEYRPAFEYVTGKRIFDPSRQVIGPDADPRKALMLLGRDLKRRGIELWLFPVPSKVMVHPESFAPELHSRDVDLQNPDYAQLRRDWEAEGLTVVDPLPVLRELAKTQQVYFKTDSHWNPVGIDAAAAFLAAELEAKGKLSPRSVEWRRKEQTIPYGGDLTRMLHLEDLPLYAVEPVTVQMVSDSRGRLMKDDPAAEVLLLGDSFANIFARRSGSFPAQLAYHLGRPIDRISMDGGGAAGNRQQLLQELSENPSRLAGKKVLILEFAVRELAIGRWKKTRLPTP